MKYIRSLKVILIALLHAALLICCDRTFIKDKNLYALEKYIQSNPDSIQQILEKNKNTNFDEINRAYYNVLYIETQYKKESELLPYDSLLDASIDILEDSNWGRIHAKALLFKGKIWDELEAPQEALKNYLLALELIEDTDYDLITSIYSSIGTVYLDQELYDDAMSAFYTAYNKTSSDQNLLNKYTNSRNLGIGYFLLENPDSSYYYLRKAYDLASLHADSIKLKDVIYNDLGLYFSEKDNNDEALKFMHKITKMTDNYHLNLGCIYSKTNNYELALENLQVALKSPDIGIRTTALKQISGIEEEFGFYESSLKYLHDFIDAYDSLTVKTYTGEIYSINQIHNIDKELTWVNNKHKSLLITLVSCSIIVILIVMVIAIIIDKKKKIKQAKELLAREKKIMENEKHITILQKQINETKNTILKLKYENSNIAKETQDDLVKEKEESIEKMEKQINNLRILLFNNNPIYKKLIKLDNQEDPENLQLLPSNDRIELNNLIKNIYSELFEELTIQCPSLTEEDKIFCCLAKMNLSHHLICACTGYPRTASARQRKHRIKKKMTENLHTEKLYNSIFPTTY